MQLFPGEVIVRPWKDFTTSVCLNWFKCDKNFVPNFSCHGFNPVMDRTQARNFFLFLLLISVASKNYVQAQDTIQENVVSPVKPLASVYPAPGGSVPIDSFHKKSQYIIVASKIIRPNTFYQVSRQDKTGNIHKWRHAIKGVGQTFCDTLWEYGI